MKFTSSSKENMIQADPFPSQSNEENEKEDFPGGFRDQADSFLTLHALWVVTPLSAYWLGDGRPKVNYKLQQITVDSTKLEEFYQHRRKILNDLTTVGQN
jgi:hypothetical protein